MEAAEATRHGQRQYPAGRCCEEDGCKTVLSIYNPDTKCSLHERKKRSKAGFENGRGVR